MANPIVQSSTNFSRVRDGRESPDAYFDIDLTNAGDRIITIAGNSFYIDANPADGNAVVYFQDTDNLRGPTPFYVSPGFIARIPFTQIRVTNLSQPGKKIRIVYGIDTDFQPGSVSQVSFAGEVTVNDQLSHAAQSYFITLGSPVGFNVATLVAPAANLNGINVKSVLAQIQSVAGGVTTSAIMAALVTPVAFGGTQQAVLCLTTGQAGQSGQAYEYNMARIIPPGWGLYAVNQSISVTGNYALSATFQVL